MIYCEGRTEWHVIRKLNLSGILQNALITQIGDADAHIKNDPSSITPQFLGDRPQGWSKFLLIYDQENYSTPQDFVNQRFSHLGPWIQITGNSNIFCTILNGRLVYLHVNTAPSPNGYKDFDGYLLDLINRLGPQAAQILFRSLPSYIRNAVVSSNIENAIHQIGTQDIPNLMASNGFPIQRSKGHLYAYITALQMSKSHVWFAEKLVEAALQNGFIDEVQRAFATLIEAWNRLIQGVCP